MKGCQVAHVPREDKGEQHGHDKHSQVEKRQLIPPLAPKLGRSVPFVFSGVNSFSTIKGKREHYYSLSRYQGLSISKMEVGVAPICLRVVYEWQINSLF